MRPAIHGRINDLDSHLQVPISRWGEVFGDATARFGERFSGISLFDATDEPELTTESVWKTKGTAAPGASTPEGRLAAMDVMGIQRQLRVTPFFWERTARQIERYGMPEIYAFSTDFPHPEGGTDPIGRMAADIEPLGDEALEAFFVSNAELLLPA